MVHTPLDVFSLIAYAAVLAAALVFTYYRASFGVALLIALAPFAFYRDIGETTLTLSKAALLGVALALVIRRVNPVALLERPARALLSAGIFLTIVTALSMAQAHYIHPAIRETLKVCEYLLLFATVYLAYRGEPNSALVRVAFCATVTVVAILALAQEFFGAPSGLLINHHVIPRIAGPLEGPNQLAAYLEITLPLLFAFARTPSPLLLVALTLGTCAEVLTFSRGGIISAAIALVIVFMNLPRDAIRNVIRPLLAGAGTATIIVIFWGAVAESLGILRLWNFEEVNYAGGVGTRRELWTAAIKLWEQRPIFGIGAGNFELEIPRVGPHDVRTHANSLYLQSLVELGVPGLVATCYLVWRSIRSFASERLASPIVLGALAGSIALAIHQLADLLIFYPKVGATWWIILAMSCAELSRTRQKTTP